MVKQIEHMPAGAGKSRLRGSNQLRPHNLIRLIPA